MKVNELILKSVGAFKQSETIKFHPKLSIFTGLNGSGKSLCLLTPYALIRRYIGNGHGDTEIRRLDSYCNNDSFAKVIVEEHNKFNHLALTAQDGGLSFGFSCDSIGQKSMAQKLGRFGDSNDATMMIYIDPARGGFVDQRESESNMLTWRYQSTHERFRRFRSYMKLINDLDGTFWEDVQSRMNTFFSTDKNRLLVPSRSRSLAGTGMLATNVNSFGTLHELESAATGGIEALFIVAETTNLKNSVIIVDTPEAHLHPHAQEMMATYLEYLTTDEGGANQVVIATHSMSIIYKCKLGFVYNLRREDGNVRAESIIQEGVPTREYEYAMDALGNSRESFIRMRDFYRNYVRENNPSEPTGGWLV